MNPERFLEQLMATRQGKEIMAQERKDETARRQKVLAEIVAFDAQHEKEMPPLISAEEEARAEYDKAAATFRAAEAKLREASAAASSASLIYSSRVGHLKAELRDEWHDIFGRVSDFRHDIQAAIQRGLPKSVGHQENTGESYLSGEQQIRILTNWPNIQAATEQLRQLSNEAEDIVFLADRSEAEERLAELRQRMKDVVTWVNAAPFVEVDTKPKKVSRRAP